MPWFKRKQAEHHAAVYDTQPIPGDATQFDPYFIAMCECDWLGPARQSSEEAFQDAYAHTDNVDKDLKRPVG
ncbi:MAG TPA: hypothetical protein VM690_08855 [Gaiellaceae bacterium]|nr:hypothetical protein [Gaiellaceae bacterium]